MLNGATARMTHKDHKMRIFAKSLANLRETVELEQRGKPRNVVSVQYVDLEALLFHFDRMDKESNQDVPRKDLS